MDVFRFFYLNGIYWINFRKLPGIKPIRKGLAWITGEREYVGKDNIANKEDLYKCVPNANEQDDCDGLALYPCGGCISGCRSGYWRAKADRSVLFKWAVPLHRKILFLAQCNDPFFPVGYFLDGDCFPSDFGFTGSSLSKGKIELAVITYWSVARFIVYFFLPRMGL